MLVIAPDILDVPVTITPKVLQRKPQEDEMDSRDPRSRSQLLGNTHLGAAVPAGANGEHNRENGSQRSSRPRGGQHPTYIYTRRRQEGCALPAWRLAHSRKRLEAKASGEGLVYWESGDWLWRQRNRGRFLYRPPGGTGDAWRGSKENDH